MSNVNDHPEILLYTRIRKSPFFYASRRHGVAMYSVYNHTYHPRHYGDPVEEYWHLLNGVTLWDVGVEKQVEITGPDAFTFTNMLVPRDLNKCNVRQCKYVFITAEDGGIINDPVLLRLDTNHFWISVADSDVLLWAKGVAYGSDLDVTIGEADVGPVQVQGPKSAEVMVDLFGDSVLEIPYYYLAPYELEGLDVVVSRTGYTSELGYDWMVDLDQESDFIGKDALRLIKERGVTQKLAGVEIEGPNLGSYNDGAMIDFFPVYAGGKEVGRVTSACYSPRLERNIGFAMVPVELAELGSELEVETPHGRSSAVIVEKPFVDPKKETPKQKVGPTT